MIWILEYSGKTPAARAYSVNDDSGRTLIHSEAKAELANLKALLDDENTKAVLDAKAYEQLAADFKHLSCWYIDYLKAEREF